MFPLLPTGQQQSREWTEHDSGKSDGREECIDLVLWIGQSTHVPTLGNLYDDHRLDLTTLDGTIRLGSDPKAYHVATPLLSGFHET